MSRLNERIKVEEFVQAIMHNYDVFYIPMKYCFLVFLRAFLENACIIKIVTVFIACDLNYSFKRRCQLNLIQKYKICGTKTVLFVLP